MKAFKYIFVFILVLGLIVPAASGQEEPEIPEFGTLYGDLYVILRDEGGVPILSADGCIQPISSVTASVTISTIDPNDPLIIDAIAGEPFGLPTYTDTAGDLVECELAEGMADWVQAVDFGRLNLGRAPDSVIAHAFDEAITKLNAATAIGLDPSGRLTLTLPVEENDYVVKTIDSPAENLALYIKMMTDGHWITAEEDTEPIVNGGRPEGKGPPEGDGPSTEPRPVLSEDAVDLLALIGYGGLGEVENRTTGEDLTSDELLLAASLLAAAADKTGNITLDKLMYINSIYGINQVGSLTTTVEGERYFNFGVLSETDPYVREITYGDRQSGLCDPGWIWVLQPELDEDSEEVDDHFVTTCMNILGYELVDTDPGYQANAVHFTQLEEAYTTVFDANNDPLEYDFTDNVRAFVQASDDALQVLEYVHNYKVPEVLYPPEPESE